MTELPDLTVSACILARRFKGKKLTRLEVTVAKKLNVSEAALRSAPEGGELKAVTLEGKTLQLHFSCDQVLGIHLMLRGELVGLHHGQVPRFQIIAFYFQDGEGFAVIDMQKQATPTLSPKPVSAPDTLQLEKEYFTELLAKKRTLIKTLLMDQHLMRGIGNSYADMILYHAGISPFSIANAIPPKNVAGLFDSIHSVLENAIEQISEANGDELKGELQDFLEIHLPHQKITAKGEAVKTEKIGGRTTYYTDEQKLFQ